MRAFKYPSREPLAQPKRTYCISYHLSSLSFQYCFTSPTTNQAQGYCSCQGGGDALTTTPSPCCTAAFEGMGADNTMCLYCSPQPAPECGNNVIRAELTDVRIRDTITHNDK